MKPFARLSRLLFLSSTYFGCLVAARAQVVVNVISPSNNSRDSSPVHYIASASSPQCSQGIASMRIYTAPHVSVYTVKSDHLDVGISIGPGYFNTVVQAWDNCGNVGSTPVNIVVRNGNLSSPRFLYDAEYSTGNVAGFSVNATTGALTSTTQVPVKAGKNPSQLTSDAGGYRLYVVNQGSQDLNAYFINRANGFLTAVPGSPFKLAGSGTSVAVTPSGKFVYAGSDSSQGGRDGINAFAVDTSGSLTEVPGSPFSAGVLPGSIAVDPTGHYLYVGHESSANPDAYQLDAFAIDTATGALKPVAGEPYTIPIPSQCFFCEGGGVYDLRIDVNGTYLLAPVFNDGTIAIYRIDAADGTLAPAAGSPFIISLPDSPTDPGAQPSSITLDGENLFIYTDDLTGDGEGDNSRNAIDGWGLNSSTGSLTFWKRFIVPQGTCDQNSIRSDPSGEFLYAAADSKCQQYGGPPLGPGVILGLTSSGWTGALSLIPGSPFGILGDPVNSVDHITVTP